MSIPAALLTLLLFTVPQGNSTLQIVYMLVTNLLMTSAVYTAIAIPYGSLMVVRTNSTEERGKMGVYRALREHVPGMAIVLAVIPVTNALGGTQSAWVKFAAIMALIVLLCLLFCYKKSKETATADGVETATTVGSGLEARLSKNFSEINTGFWRWLWDWRRRLHMDWQIHQAPITASGSTGMTISWRFSGRWA